MFINTLLVNSQSLIFGELIKFSNSTGPVFWALKKVAQITCRGGGEVMAKPKIKFFSLGRLSSEVRGSYFKFDKGDIQGSPTCLKIEFFPAMPTLWSHRDFPVATVIVFHAVILVRLLREQLSKQPNLLTCYVPSQR